MRQKLFAEAAAPGLEEYREVVFDGICQHLVMLGVRTTRLDEHGNSDGLEHLSHYTFFVASVGQQWYLVTAGHVLEALDELFAATDERVELSFLADNFGSLKKENKPLHFPYRPGMGWHVYDKVNGIDFGFIPLTDEQKEDLLIGGNQSLSDAHWTRTDDPELRAYWMLGLPGDLNQSCNEPNRSGEPRKGVAAVVMLSLNRIDEADVTEDPRGWQTELPRFIGRINVDIPFGIEGMSGGPIFGLCRLPNGNLGYTVVALQSEWYPDTKTIFACPVHMFGELLASHVKGEIQTPEESG
ncbi:MAG: hypothetical protein JWO38_3011 [Gemmataceae bacterium]|nr:hypothetical protein [Gemmataceae bacterium]